MRRAFTVLELLVVVAIVGLIASILFPVMAQAKVAAQKAVSLSNVRQITLAQFLYADDNAGSVAMNRDCDLVGEVGRFAECQAGKGFRGWIDLTEPYVKSYAVFKSPADPTEPHPLPADALDATGLPIRAGAIWGSRENGRRLLGGDFRSSYARNNNFANNGTYTAQMEQSPYPGTLVLIYSFTANTGAGATASEGIPGSTFTIVRDPLISTDSQDCPAYQPGSSGNVRSNFFGALPDYGRELERARPSSRRYAGKAIYGFADGHAQALSPESIKGQCGWGTGRGVEFGNNGREPDFRF
ncbi:prepilin-type N-terminal cleavage/methylation domain-containing protein [bacterium]|nr:MAG: prepilin-type N-terminal cleavage/methylation domain-containing protein [bacterium]